MYATTHTVTLQGAAGQVIDVRVDVSSGTASTTLVGRPDIAISEARERCRAAIANSGFEFPATKRVTVLLAPADVPKRGPHFDLAVAVGLIAASEERFPQHGLCETALIGELALDGRLRCVHGILPMVMAAAARGLTTVYVPEPQLAEATLVPGVTVIGVRSLRQAVALLAGWDEVPQAPPVEPLATTPLLSWRGAAAGADVDLADVAGLADARFALEVAAAGGHHLHLSGPRGSGKTTLAERLVTVLPDLEPDEILELTAIHSLSGSLPTDGSDLTRPPSRSPHHSSSRTSMLGGGSGRVHPGEVSKAHLGVLFLDEFPLFRRDVIEGLREPLESGQVSISRADDNAVFPANTLVVLASNPCPCGDYHRVAQFNSCTCGEVSRRSYQARLSGPILDRVDITRHVLPVTAQHLDRRFESPEPSAQVRARVTSARLRQAGRYAGQEWRLNAQVPGPALKRLWPLDDAAEAQLNGQLLDGRLTQRGVVRVHRLAWSVADLSGVEVPGRAELDVALALRAGDPLPVRVLTPSEVDR